MNRNDFFLGMGLLGACIFGGILAIAYFAGPTAAMWAQAITSGAVAVVALYAVTAPLDRESKRVDARALFQAYTLLPRTIEIQKELEFAIRFSKDYNYGLDWAAYPETVREALLVSDAYSDVNVSDGWALPRDIAVSWVFLARTVKQYESYVRDQVGSIRSFDDDQRGRHIELVRTLQESMSSHLSTLMTELSKLTNEQAPE